MGYIYDIKKTDQTYKTHAFTAIAENIYLISIKHAALCAHLDDILDVCLYKLKYITYRHLTSL